MGFWWAGLWAMIAPLVYRVGRALGVGFVTYVGTSFVLDQLLSYVQGQFSQLPSQLIALLGLMGVDSAVSLIFSAVAAKAAISGWNGGSKRHPVWQEPGTNPTLPA